MKNRGTEVGVKNRGTEGGGWCEGEFKDEACEELVKVGGHVEEWKGDG